MKKLLLLLLILPILFAGTPGAMCNFHPQDEDAQKAYDTAMGLVPIAIMFSVLVVALTYMIGKATANPRLLVFSKDELMHLLFTVLIVVSIFGIFEGSCHFFSTFLGGGEGPLQKAIHYSSQLETQGKSTLRSLLKHSVSEKFKAARMFGYFAPLVGGETAFTSSYHNAFARQYEIVADLVTVGMVASGVQHYLLYFIQDFVFPIMLPFGLILRALPVVREAGNVILAITFALLVILPFAYSVNATAASIPKDMLDFCDSDREVVLGDCATLTGWGRVSAYLFQTIFLPNLAMIVFIAGATAMVKIAKVIP